MTTPHHDESKPRRRWPTYLAVVLLLVLVVYPLSIGPAYLITYSMDLPTEPMSVFYRPLFYVVKKTGTYKFLDAYSHWWMKMAE